MSERRRFFPSSPVQTVPGRSVELEMQLRPLAPVPAVAPAPPPAPGGCDVIGVGWLFGSSWEDGNEWWSGETLPDGRLRIWDEWNEDNSSVWEGEPAHYMDDYMPPHRPRTVPGPGFRCTYLSVAWDWSSFGRTFHAVLQGGAMTDAHWRWQWPGRAEDEPLSALGHAVEAWGNVLQVRLTYEWPDDYTRRYEELLVARAFCGGNQVGEVQLRAVFPGYSA